MPCSLFPESAAERGMSAGSSSARGIRKGSLPPLREADPNSGRRGLCQPGVLQLVPAVDRHIPTFVEKTRGRSGAPADQRVMQKNIGVQTASAAKAMFAADNILRTGRH